MQVEILRTPSGFLKVWEIAISIIVISVSQGVKDFNFYCNEKRAIFYGGTLIASLVVTPLLLITYVSGTARELQRAPFEMMFNGILAVFMVAAGGVVIATAFDIGDIAYGDFAFLSKGADAGKAAGSFAIINGVLYGLDTFFAMKNMEG